MNIFNAEHYPDPTAADAMEHVMRPDPGPLPPVSDDGILRLAEAVVVTAVKDYTDLLRCPWRSEALLREKRELEAFFLSGWFRRISGLNGAAILSKIRKEVLRGDRA